MNSEELLKIIACPKTKQSLRFANVFELKNINEQILSGVVIYANGESIKLPLDGALISSDGKLGYAIIEGISVLLEDKAIIFLNGELK
jgi:uncharacterized protein YbaR (Trm112 family)